MITEKETAASRTPSAEALAWLIHPLPIDTFTREHYDREFLHIAQRGKDYYASIFSWEDFERLAMQALAVDTKSVRMVKQEINIPIDQAGAHALHQVRRSYLEGWTINVNGIERFWLPIQKLLRGLDPVFLADLGVNLYLTPGKGARGFPPHADAHDTTILQIGGRKRWTIFGRSPQEPSRELVLAPGDLLYVPTGRRHVAASIGEGSLHLTLGVPAYRKVDMLRDLIAILEKEDDEAREAVPFVDGRIQASPELERALARLLQRCLDRSSAAELIRARSIGRIDELAPAASDLFDAELEDLDTDTLVKKREGMCSYVIEQAGQVLIGFPGNAVAAPKVAETALRFIADRAEPFRVGDLVGLDGDSQKVLVRRLILEGLLTQRI